MILASVSYPPVPMIHIVGLHLSIRRLHRSRHSRRGLGGNPSGAPDDVAAFQAVLTMPWSSADRGPVLTVPAAVRTVRVGGA
jgi:hypothetical protein